MADDPIEEPDPEETEDDDDEDEPVAAGEGETSLDEIVEKHVAVVEDDEEEEESLLDLSREERLESLSIRAVPKRANEFICKSCYLVKNFSQMADKKRELCRDCV